VSDSTDFNTRAGQRLDLPEPPLAQTGSGATGMEYSILGSTMQAAVLELDPGETIFSESGAMSWMSGNIHLKSTGRGSGVKGLLKRAVSGESIFVIEYTSEHGKGQVAFTSPVPGRIVPVHLAEGQEIVAQKQSFLAAERTVQMDIFFRRRLGAGFFGGEGFIMQKFTGPGVVFAALDGESVEYTLEQGEVLKVDTGHVALIESSVGFDVQRVRGIRNVLFGGEGIFLTMLTGPGRVWLQTMPIMNLAQAIAEYLPQPSTETDN
jgi:uncharacterized protein (TIGR00266 family)